MSYNQRQHSNSHNKDTGLHIRPVNRNDVQQPFPKFNQPQPQGYFSIDTLRSYESTAKQLRYFKPPTADKYPLDLNHGLSLAIKKPETVYEERLVHLLTFISENLEKLRSPRTELMNESPVALNAEFICWRGLLRLVMCTPYENGENWAIYVTRYKGNFYLYKSEEEDNFKRANETVQQHIHCAYGFKFEQYCLSESPTEEPNTSEPVDECAEFSVVFKTKIGGLSLLYGAEVDGIISEERVEIDKNTKLENLKFIELKVCQKPTNKQINRTFCRFKARNWWCQSFLVGIEDIYMGLRTEQGMVYEMESLKVAELPKLGAEYWKANVCANFLKKFLMTVKSTMSNVDCPDTTYKFCYDARSARITYKCLGGKTEHSFLPPWYVQQIQRAVSTRSSASN